MIAGLLSILLNVKLLIHSLLIPADENELLPGMVKFNSSPDQLHEGRHDSIPFRCEKRRPSP